MCDKATEHSLPEEILLGLTDHGALERPAGNCDERTSGARRQNVCGNHCGRGISRMHFKSCQIQQQRHIIQIHLGLESNNERADLPEYFREN